MVEIKWWRSDGDIAIGTGELQTLIEQATDVLYQCFHFLDLCGVWSTQQTLEYSTEQMLKLVWVSPDSILIMQVMNEHENVLFAL